MKLKPGMVFGYVFRQSTDPNDPELLIIINISPLPLRRKLWLVVYKVEDSQLHTISSCTLLKFYKLLYPAEEKREK